MVYALKRAGAEKKEGRSKGLFKDLKFTIDKELVFIVIVTFIYFFVLLNILYFEISSAIYLFFIIKVFWKKGKLIHVILVSLILPFVMSLLFYVFFALLLPGDSLLMELMIFIRRL